MSFKNSFMQPEVYHGSFYIVETDRGECEMYPKEDFSLDSIRKMVAPAKIREWSIQTGWFARLSASGYLDCTSWVGPFASEQDAMDEMTRMYDDDSDDDEDSENSESDEADA